MLKEIIQKSIVGFFFGLGMAVAGLAVIAFYDANQSLVKSWFGPSYERFGKGAIPSALKITKHKQRTDSEMFTVVGFVENDGEDSYRDVEVRIDIKDNEFVLGRCNGYVDRGQFLNKGETSPFIIECRDLKTLENQHPYEIYINYALEYK
mgnify:CR=1 FL=1